YQAWRRHSVLTKAGDPSEISDCESPNGTFVNGVPASRRRLEHGDQIEIGASKFLFLLRESDSDGHDGPGGVRLDLNDVRLGSTVRLAPTDALYLQPERVGASLPAARGGRIALALQVRLTASRQLAQARTVAELGEKLVGLALEAVPAERGALLLPGDDDGFQAAAQKDRAPGRSA